MHRKHHILVLLGLIGLATLIQAVVIGRATVPSLDAVRFVKTAQAVESQGLLPGIQTTSEQPLFPAWVAVVHQGLTWPLGERPSIWATSAQVAAAIPLVLTVLPLYLMLLRLLGTRTAVIGSMLFCVLPEVRRLGADGISDSTHLLFLTTALWSIVEYWTTTARARAAWLVLAGLLTGLALMTRAESIVLPLALTLCLATACTGRQSILSIRLASGHAAAYVFGLVVVLVPYVLATGAYTPQTALARVLGRAATTTSPSSSTLPATKTLWQTPEGHPLQFPVMEGNIRQRGFAAALLQYGEELADVFGYWLFLPALWALWRHRKEFTRPADRFLKTFFVVFSIALIHFVSIEGYLSARHLLPLLVVGLGVAALGLCEASEVLCRLRPLVCSAPRFKAPGLSGAYAVLAMIFIVYLASAAQPLRAHRQAHRQVGDWLSRQTATSNPTVLDTRGWTMLYSQRPTYQYDEAKTAFCDSRLGYIVIERRELRYDSERARTLQYLLQTHGRRVAQFNGPGKSPAGAVDVYRWNAESLSPPARPTRVARLARLANEREGRSQP